MVIGIWKMGNNSTGQLVRLSCKPRVGDKTRVGDPLPNY